MAKLGSLYYDLFLKDLTDKDVKAIEKKLKNLGVELDTKKLTESLKNSVESYKGKDVALGVKSQSLHDSIRAALKKPEFPIKVRVEAASAQQAVRDALQHAGLQRGFTAADKRQYDAETKRLTFMTRAQSAAAAANALAQQRLARAHNIAESSARNHTSATISLNSALRGNITLSRELGSAIGAAYSVVALKNFMTKVVEIGGELEKQKLAMKAILGDEGFANTISSQINTLAVKSPFGIMELNQYAKQLTAFQIPYNELYDTMKRMADISAAVGVDMGRIILAYGQVRAAKFLKGTELRQFTEANIPLIDMLADRFTKLKGEIISAGDIMDMVSNKEISFEDVKAVLWDLTGEGGYFYNMQEVLSESVQAKWKNLADAIDLMFADIAESASGPLKELAEILTELTTRWRTLSTIIMSAAGVYGTYRIALFAANKLIAANNAAILLNTIAVGANITKWQWLKAKTAESISSMAANVKRFVKSTKGILTLASIGIGAVIEALVVLWQRNNEEMEKAKSFGEDLFTKATEGAKNLSEAMDGMSKSSDGMGDVALQTGVEKLSSLIRDYSDTPDADITDSLINQQGEVATLAEQYDALLAKLNELTAAYKEAERLNLGRVMSESIEDADSGWFDDNLLTDIEDYKNKWNEAQRDIAKYAREYRENIIKAVDEAKTADAGFALATEGMRNYDAMYAELVRNADKYADAIVSLRNKGGDIYEPVRLGYLSFHGGSSDVRKSEKELIAEWEETLKNVKSRLLMADVDIENLSRPLKTSLISTFKKAMEGMDGPVRKQMEDMVSEILPSLKIANDDLSKSISDSFAAALTKASPLLADEVRYGKAYSDLSEAERELVDKLMEEARENTKKVFPDYVDELQRLLDSSDFTAKIYLKFSADQSISDLQKMLWKGVGVVPTEYTSTFERWSKGATSVEEIQTNAVNEGKKIMAQLDAAKKNSNVTKEHLKKLQDLWDIAAGTYSNMGGGSLTEAVRGKGKSGTDTDDFAKSLRLRFKDIKDAYAMYKGWAKLEGKEAAFKRVGASGLFSTLDPDKIPQTVDEYLALIDELEKELKTAGIKGKSQRGTLARDLVKERFGINKDTFNEQLKLALDKVSKEAERQLADWNLFDKIRKATGNQDLAMSIAFGMNTDAETDYPAMVKKQFNNFAKAAKSTLTFGTITPELLAKAPDEVKKAWEKANSDIVKYFDQQRDAVAGILTEYQTLQDKIDAINAKRKLALETINAKDKEGNYILSDEERAKRARIANTQADYDIFTRSNDYLRLFNDIYGLTMDEANRIGDLIQFNLNKQLQDGLITIYDYEKQMEKVRKQLEALRNVKSDAMTFLTGGLKGLNQKRLQKAEGELANNADYQNALKEQIAAQNALDEAKETGNEKAIEAAEAQLALANQSVKAFTKIRDAIIADQEKMQNILDVANIAANIAGGISDAFNSIRDMADAYGFDSESNAWLNVGGVIDTLTSVTSGVSKVVQSAMSGDIGGILSGAGSTITTPFTIWSKLHDKKLQKLIDRSKEAAQIMQNQYDILEKRMANFLGNAASLNTGVEGGAYGKQRELMGAQLEELEKQRQAEIDKKKTDNSVVEDYNKQIEEMKISIRDFAQEAAKTIYGIDINGWAEQLGDSLVDAFAAGEDAAEAFDRTVGDIMRDVISKMISQDILAPMFGDLRNYLFGENGMGGAFGADFKLDASEVAVMKEYLDKIKNEGIPAAEELFNAINSATGGMLDDTDKAKSGLSAGIQSITEDTADLLASYVNAIRASVAMNETRWERLLGESLPQISVIAQSQLECQRQIAANTLRNAVAAETLVEKTDKLERSWRRIAERNWGYS